MDKNTIRKQALTARKNLSEKQRKEKSKAICDKLKPYLHGFVALYEPYGSEVDVSELKDLLDSYALPKTLDDKHMQFYRVNHDTILKESAFHILEPEGAKVVEKTDIDVMIIPIVAFDDKMHRMGHGKGYYDRYLQDYHGLRIGVAYMVQRVSEVMQDVHDEAMDMIVTEETIYCI